MLQINGVYQEFIVRVLSGIQPSGSLHIGNYFAMMKRMIEYQEKNELYYFLVNYHALTTITDAELLRRNTFEAACDTLALGIDPERAVFWVQSDIPEVVELTWLLCNVTPVGLLERAHSFKDKTAKGMMPNHGLFTYPVLMAADILLFGGELVPVGKDQKQHLEITRDIAIKFNNTYGETFVVPEPDIQEEMALIPGVDGQKMSKSYDNTIDIFSDEKSLKKRVMSILSDSTPVDEPKDPDNSTIFQIFQLFLDGSGVDSLRQRFLKPGLRYGDVKKELFGVIWEYFLPFRKKREELANNRDHVFSILKRGAERARATAEPFLRKARENTGIHYSG